MCITSTSGEILKIDKLTPFFKRSVTETSEDA